MDPEAPEQPGHLSNFYPGLTLFSHHHIIIYSIITLNAYKPLENLMSFIIMYKGQSFGLETIQRIVSHLYYVLV